LEDYTKRLEKCGYHPQLHIFTALNGMKKYIYYIILILLIF
jgi:hypothetical protein